MSNVECRDYRDTDLAACLAVFDSNVGTYFLPSERAEFADFLGALPGPYLVLVAEGGSVVGCGGYAVPAGEGRADLCWGMVRQDLHGRGLGRLLTRVRIDRVRDDPRVREILLRTSQHTAGFYEALGFRTSDVVEDGYGPGLDRHDMRLTLEG